jgi:hypothetical protein
MINSIDQIKKNYKYLPFAYKASNNIPLDTRFIVSSLSTINTEIPLDKRYEGLIFFVLDQTISDGTDVVLTGVLYCFEKDLTKPVALHEVANRFNIKSISGFSNNYSTIFAKLNKTFTNIGSIIYVQDLDVCLIKYSSDVRGWKYLSGIYSVPNDATYLTIPLELREIGKIVIVNGEDRIIKNDTGKTLSSVIMIYSQKSEG